MISPFVCPPARQVAEATASGEFKEEEDKEEEEKEEEEEEEEEEEIKIR